MDGAGSQSHVVPGHVQESPGVVEDARGVAIAERDPSKIHLRAARHPAIVYIDRDRLRRVGRRRRFVLIPLIAHRSRPGLVVHAVQDFLCDLPALVDASHLLPEDAESTYEIESRIGITLLQERERRWADAVDPLVQALDPDFGTSSTMRRSTSRERSSTSRASIT
jgi:hypothetical protein